MKAVKLNKYNTYYISNINTLNISNINKCFKRNEIVENFINISITLSIPH